MKWILEALRVFVCEPCAKKAKGEGGWHCGSCACCKKKFN